MSDEADPSAAGAPFRASVARTPADVLVLVERIRMHAAEVERATRTLNPAPALMLAMSAAMMAVVITLVLFPFRGWTEFAFACLLIAAAAMFFPSLGAVLANVGRRVLAGRSPAYRLRYDRLEQALQMAAGALGSDPALRREHAHAWLLLTEAVELGNDVLQRAPRPRRSPSEPAASPPSSGDPTPTPPLMNKHLVNGEFH